VRHGWVLIVALLVSGCAYPLARVGDPQTATLTRELPPTSALVLPPPGGPAVIAVLEERFANAVKQRIVLDNDSSTPGQNEIDATFWGPTDPRNVPLGNRVPMDHTKLADIQKELREAFPRVAMRISDYYVQNGYGPFGYAVGRTASGSMCLYAWQLISAPRNKFGQPASGGAIRLRVRLCRGRTTEDLLLRFMYGLTISGYFLPYGWNPYGPAPDVAADVGGIGSPMLPTPDGENPYYVDVPAGRREGRVLPVAAAPVRRAPVSTSESAYPTTVPTLETTVGATPIEPPLGMPSALPGTPASGSAAPTGPVTVLPTLPAGAAAGSSGVRTVAPARTTTPPAVTAPAPRVGTTTPAPTRGVVAPSPAGAPRPAATPAPAPATVRAPSAAPAGTILPRSTLGADGQPAAPSVVVPPPGAS